MRARWLLTLLALTALGWAAGQTRAFWKTEAGPGDPRLAWVDESLVSVVYTLHETRWLVFTLPPSVELIRVISNASLPAEEASRPPVGAEPGWRYALDYQLLDSGGRVLLERRYHQATRLTAYRDARGEAATGGFYLGQSVRPVDSRLMLINLRDAPPGVARLGIRLAEKDTGLADVAVRVYHRETLPPHRLRYLWQRMSAERKEMLARANVYPAELLTESEKRHLLESRWAALAPVGIEESHYERRRLYTPKDLPGEEMREEPHFTGFRLGGDLRGVIPLPESGGRVRLVVEPVRPQSGGPGTIRMLWYGRELAARWEQEQPWTGGSVLFESTLGGGTIEVTAPEEATLQAFLTRPGAGAVEEEITPEPTYVWAYLAEGGSPVEFQVLHDGPAPTPLRLDLRRAFPARPAGGDPAPIDVAYELLAEGGRPLARSALRLETPSSSYDVWLTRGLLIRLSEPASYYFSLDPDVARLRVGPLAAPVLVTAYDRPSGLPRRIAVPEDSFDFDREAVAQRSWFLLRAANDVDLARQNRAPRILVQPRPPAESPEVRAGRYHWEDFPPEDPSAARQVLVPWRGGIARQEALAAAFCEVGRDREISLELESGDGRQEVAPTLLYLRTSPGPIDLRVYWDDRLRRAVTVHAARGQVALPALPLGPHRLRVLASRAARLFLNHVETCRGTRLLKRLAHRLPPGGLSFLVSKRSPAEETVSARLYAPWGARTRIAVRVKLEPPRAVRAGWPRPSWTFPERLYSVRPAGGSPAPVLESGLDDVDQGQIFSIPLGGDLPPGRYRIHVTPQSPSRAWLALSRITPGVPERRLVFFEGREAR